MSDSEGGEDVQCHSAGSDGDTRSPATSMTDVRGGGSEKESCLKPLDGNEDASAETMKEIILPRLLEDRIEQRNSGINHLLIWLRKNEPQWVCPPKVQGSTGSSNGLRPDNIMLVYDSHNLPNTEQKWNATHFMSKTNGHFTWPPDGNISLPARSAIPVGIQMNAVDIEIVEWFSNRENLHKLLEFTLFAENCSGNDDLVNVVRCLLRNYPDVAATRLLPPLREGLERMLAGRHVYVDPKKAYPTVEPRRLSADLFVAIATGTKYLPFNVLDDLWKWMAPAVIEYLDEQHYGVTEAWSTAFEKLLRDEDPRRFWWIVETLIDSTDACKTLAPDERWKLENRVSLFKNLGSVRHSETLNRLISMAFSQLIPMATSESMIKCIADLLVTSDAVAHDHSELLGRLPERFRLRPLGYHLMKLAQDLEIHKISRKEASSVLQDAIDSSEEDKENRRVEEVTEPRTSSSASDPSDDKENRRDDEATSSSASSSTSSSDDSSSISSEESSACSEEDPKYEQEFIYKCLFIDTIFAFYELSNRPITDVIFKDGRAQSTTLATLVSKIFGDFDYTLKQQMFTIHFCLRLIDLHCTTIPFDEQTIVSISSCLNNAAFDLWHGIPHGMKGAVAEMIHDDHLIPFLHGAVEATRQEEKRHLVLTLACRVMKNLLSTNKHIGTTVDNIVTTLVRHWPLLPPIIIACLDLNDEDGEYINLLIHDLFLALQEPHYAGLISTAPSLLARIQSMVQDPSSYYRAPEACVHILVNVLMTTLATSRPLLEPLLARGVLSSIVSYYVSEDAYDDREEKAAAVILAVITACPEWTERVKLIVDAAPSDIANPVVEMIRSLP